MYVILKIVNKVHNNRFKVTFCVMPMVTLCFGDTRHYEFLESYDTILPKRYMQSLSFSSSVKQKRYFDKYV